MELQASALEQIVFVFNWKLYVQFIVQRERERERELSEYSRLDRMEQGAKCDATALSLSHLTVNSSSECSPAGPELLIKSGITNLYRPGNYRVLEIEINKKQLSLL